MAYCEGCREKQCTIDELRDLVSKCYNNTFEHQGPNGLTKKVEQMHLSDGPYRRDNALVGHTRSDSGYDSGENLSDLKAQITELNKQVMTLKQQLASREKLQQNLQHELQRQKRQYDQELQNLVSKDAAMQIQLDQYRSDFDSEKRRYDEEKRKSEDLELTLSVVQRQLASFQQQQMTVLHQRRIDALQRHRAEWERNHPGTYSRSSGGQFIPHGQIQCDGPSGSGTSGEPMDGDGDGDYDTIDGSSPPAKTSSTRTARENDENNMLECPRCREKYSPHLHSTFLDHIEACCN